jgi:hypothetical protein
MWTWQQRQTLRLGFVVSFYRQTFPVGTVNVPHKLTLNFKVTWLIHINFMLQRTDVFVMSLTFVHSCCWTVARIAQWAGRPRGRSSNPCKVKNFLCSTSSRPALRPTQPPIQWVLGALSPGAKRPGREADHSPLTVSEGTKLGSMHLLPHTPSGRSV